MHFLQQKNILLGITGGIAAYKTIELIRQLRDAGANVRVVVTKEALSFVTPLTLQTISGHKIYTDLLDAETESGMSHIDLARWADVLIIAPATANIIAKIAHGIADDLLTTLCLATTAKLAIVPAMNQQMWLNPATQHNHSILQKRGILSWGPGFGAQACGEFGPGRMIEAIDIFNEICDLFLPKILQGKHIIITAGPTIEPIDPVRFISNHSSGKMGYALAQAAVELGARTTLISGPSHLSPPTKAQFIAVKTAKEMYETVMAVTHTCHIFIAAAAVADYRVTKISGQKIKKNKHEQQIVLAPNPDILAEVANLNKPPFTVGFAAETEDLHTNAMHKLVHKKLAMIIGNNVAGQTGGFNSDENAVSVFTQDQQIDFALQCKKQLARNLMQLIATEYQKQERLID